MGAIWIQTGKPEQAEALADELADFEANALVRESQPGVEVAVDREFNALLVDLMAATERWMRREKAEGVSLQIGDHTYPLPASPD